jgi:hypothetical protein
MEGEELREDHTVGQTRQPAALLARDLSHVRDLKAADPISVEAAPHLYVLPWLHRLLLVALGVTRVR